MQLSSLVQGYWRAHTWGFNKQQLNHFIESHVALGITSVDHAPVYAGGECEAIFGEALSLSPSLRHELEVVTKFGIYQGNPAHYDVTYDRIIESVEQSLTRLKIDEIDLLLLHRPCFLMQADEVANAFDQLLQSGKVRHFGVSNFTASQFSLLQSRCDQPLLTNQVEISPIATQHLEDGVLDQAQQLGVKPMAWSCLGGGSLFSNEAMVSCLHEMANELGVEDIESIVYAWVRQLPSNAIPIIGSGKLDRVVAATKALELELTNEQWYRIWVAGKGHGVP